MTPTPAHYAAARAAIARLTCDGGKSVKADPGRWAEAIARAVLAVKPTRNKEPTPPRGQGETK